MKRRIGYLTANTGLYTRLSPIELLEYFATLYGIPRQQARRRIDELTAALDKVKELLSKQASSEQQDRS